MPIPKTIVESLTERDVDLLLLREFHGSPGFCSWFISKTPLKSRLPIEFDGAWHSVTDAHHGESDIVLRVRDASGRLLALLIENKIDAPAQPEQGTRYRLRGEAGVAEGVWVDFATCIVAPDRYLKSRADTSSYDATISYEKLRDWFADRRGARYIVAILEQAIEDMHRGYAIVPNEEATAFFRKYFECARHEFPDLGMQEPQEKGGKADWVEFKPDTLPTGLRLIHKMNAGRVDLQVAGAATTIDVLREANRDLLGSDVELELAGKSASFLIRVRETNRFEDASEQLGVIREGLRAAYRLATLARVVKVASRQA